MKVWSDIKNSMSKVKNHLFFIILLMCFSLLSTGIISFYFNTPQYEASSDVLTHEQAAGAEGLTRDSLREDFQFIPTFREIITSTQILEQAAERFSLDQTAEELKAKITIQTRGESQIVSIAVTDEDADFAAAFANELVVLSEEEIRTLLNLDNIIVLAPAKNGKVVSGGMDDIIFNLAAAALISLFAGIGLAFLAEYFDRTIKDEQDVMEILELPLLGVISNYKAQPKDKNYKFPVSGKIADRKVLRN